MRLGHSRLHKAVIPSLFLEQTQEVDALGALNGHAQSTIPDQLGKGTESTADTEGDSVVEGLLEAIVVEENTTSSIHVGVRVLSLQESRLVLKSMFSSRWRVRIPFHAQ